MRVILNKVFVATDLLKSGGEMASTPSNGEVQELLDSVCATCPGITSIWLVGSRANGTETEISDWDLIAFGSSTSLACIRKNTELHQPGVDFLVVYDGGHFENGWGDKHKSGSLSSWKWRKVSGSEAFYTAPRFVGDDDRANIADEQKRAIRVR